MVGPPTSLNIWHLHFFKRVDGPDKGAFLVLGFISMYRGSNKLSEYVYFYMSQDITWCTFAACFPNRLKLSLYPSFSTRICWNKILAGYWSFRRVYTINWSFLIQLRLQSRQENDGCFSQQVLQQNEKWFCLNTWKRYLTEVLF